MNVKELKELAKAQGIKGYYKMKKEELLKLVKIEEESPASSPASIAEEKPVLVEKFHITLKSHAGDSSYPINGADTLRDALMVFYKTKKENKEYSLIELKMNGILVRREKISRN